MKRADCIAWRQPKTFDLGWYDLRVEKSSVSLLPGVFIALLAVVGFNLLVFGYIGVTGVSTWIVGGVVALYAWTREKNKPLVTTLALVGALAWLGIIVRANEFVQLVNFATMLGVIGLLILVLSVDKIGWQIVEVVKLVGQFGLGLLPHAFNVVGAVFATSDHKNKKWGSVLKIVVIGTGLVVIFGGLLFSSDPVFAKIVGGFLQDIWGRLVASAIVGIIVLVLTSQRLENDNKETQIFSWLSGNELAGAVVILEILFGGFLLVQARYLFASHEAFATFGVTYSDYVRQGFFQLIAAVALGGVVSYIVGMKAVKKWTKIVSLVLVFQLGLILLSAAWRNGLYIDMHGLTRIRIVGEVGVYCLAGLLALLTVRELSKELNEKRFLMGIGGIVLLGMGYINVTNMDMRIVANPPIRHERPDYFVVGNLSVDAVEGWEKVVREGSQLALQPVQVSSDTAWRVANTRLGLVAIARKRDYLVKKYKDVDWRDFNVSEYVALNRMNQDRSLYFDTLDETIRQLENKYNEVPQLRTTEEYILNDFEYPLMNISR